MPAGDGAALGAEEAGAHAGVARARGVGGLVDQEAAAAVAVAGGAGTADGGYDGSRTLGGSRVSSSR